MKIGVPVPFTPKVRDDRKPYDTPMVVKERAGRYWLVYRTRSKTGTGPFLTAFRAKQWYNGGGR